MKTCTEWKRIEYIEVTCPYCSVIDTYFKPDYAGGGEGDVIYCKNPKCENRFKLGEQE